MKKNKQGQQILAKIKERGKLEACEICHEKFGVFQREHKCKRCLKSICSKCGKKKKIIVGYPLQPQIPHRVCNNCKKESDNLDMLRKEQKMVWGSDSEVCLEWIKKLEIEESQESVQKKFEAAQNLQEDVVSTQAYEQYQTYIKLNPSYLSMVDYNYSFAEILFYLTKGIQAQHIQAAIQQVLTGFLYHHAKDIGFSPEIVHLSIFLLCFCSAPKALKILLKVYEDIIPTIFYPKLIKNIQFSLKEKQISLMIQILRDNFTVSTSLLPKIEQFFKYEGITFISSLLVPKVNFECCFFIFSQIIGSALKYNTLIKAIIGIIHIHSKLINEKGPENPVVIEYILRDTYLEALTENMNFEILPNLQPNERANTMAVVDQLQRVRDENRELLTQNDKLQKMISEIKKQSSSFIANPSQSMASPENKKQEMPSFNNSDQNLLVDQVAVDKQKDQQQTIDDLNKTILKLNEKLLSEQQKVSFFESKMSTQDMAMAMGQGPQLEKQDSGHSESPTSSPAKVSQLQLDSLNEKLKEEKLKNFELNKRLQELENTKEQFIEKSNILQNEFAQVDENYQKVAKNLIMASTEIERLTRSNQELAREVEQWKQKFTAQLAQESAPEEGDGSSQRIRELEGQLAALKSELSAASQEKVEMLTAQLLVKEEQDSKQKELESQVHQQAEELQQLTEKLELKKQKHADELKRFEEEQQRLQNEVDVLRSELFVQQENLQASFEGKELELKKKVEELDNNLLKKHQEFYFQSVYMQSELQHQKEVSQSKVQELEELKKSVRENEGKFEVLEKEKEALKKQLEDSKAQLQQTTKTLQKKEEYLIMLQNENTRALNEVKSLQKDVQSLKQKDADNQAILASLKSGSADTQQIENQIKTQYQNQFQSLNEKISALESELAQTRQQYQVQIDQLKQQLTQSQDEGHFLNEQLNLMQVKVDEAEKELKSQKSLAEQLAGESAAHQTKISEQQQQTDFLQNQLKDKNAFLNQQKELYEKKIQGLNQQVLELQTVLTVKQEEANQLQENLKQKQVQIADYQSQKGKSNPEQDDEIKELEDKLHRLNKIVDQSQVENRDLAEKLAQALAQVGEKDSSLAAYVVQVKQLEEKIEQLPQAESQITAQIQPMMGVSSESGELAAKLQSQVHDYEQIIQDQLNKLAQKEAQLKEEEKKSEQLIFKMANNSQLQEIDRLEQENQEHILTIAQLKKDLLAKLAENEQMMLKLDAVTPASGRNKEAEAQQIKQLTQENEALTTQVKIVSEKLQEQVDRNENFIAQLQELGYIKDQEIQTIKTSQEKQIELLQNKINGLEQLAQSKNIDLNLYTTYKKACCRLVLANLENERLRRICEQLRDQLSAHKK